MSDSARAPLHFFSAALGRFGRLSWPEVMRLLVSARHSAVTRHRRASVIISRVRLIALAFSVLVPLWIVVDAVFLEWPTWGLLALARIGAALGFAALAFKLSYHDEKGRAQIALALLLGIPTVFYVVSQVVLDGIALSGDFADALAFTYAFLPFAMVAGLAIFPLTVAEGGFLAALTIAMVAAVWLLGAQDTLLVSLIGTIWLLVVISVVSILACLAQLHFMIDLIEESSHDKLTGAFNRRTGEDLLQQIFALSTRYGSPCSICFVDLDRFKLVNDNFGHDEGDAALRRAAKCLQAGIRDADILIRWGGEEFVLVMPNTDGDAAVGVLRRLREAGLGMRPEGAAMTASMGLAEALRDKAGAWDDLVEIADRRMYVAKQQGRDRIVGHGDEIVS